MNRILFLSACLAICSTSVWAQCDTLIDHSGEQIKLLDQEMRGSESPIAAQVALSELICTSNPAIATAAIRWAMNSDDPDIQNMGAQGQFVRAQSLNIRALTVIEIESGEYDVVGLGSLTSEAQQAVQAGLSITMQLYGNPNLDLCFSTYFQYEDCRANTTVSYGNSTVTVSTRDASGAASLANDGTLVGMIKLKDPQQGNKIVDVPARLELN
ncbi:hypothetical protein SLH49_05190 [Cognatiyoonia sp. IB215446]|uniref:hypothetical protein n=1 Tax=Cognatiyoonia sp. IB215446 TaxID=3097355 RepID=UPI002A16B974|nr:hypothetical protein [Cognatiyoonia sp. IB215446]MDX8347376.1 hypothetical protein [Cognatiyoonia sp. IB215446]